MDNKNDIKWMFNASGNLTLEAMQAYLEGRLSREQADAFEKHINESEFDREALEGLRLTSRERVSASMAGLNERISGRSRQRRKVTFWPYYGIAASIVLIAGVIGVLNYMDNSRPETISQALPPEEEKTGDKNDAEKTARAVEEDKEEAIEESTYQLVPIQQDDKKPEEVLDIVEDAVIPETDQQVDVMVDEKVVLKEEIGERETKGIGSGVREGEGEGEGIGEREGVGVGEREGIGIGEEGGVAEEVDAVEKGEVSTARASGEEAGALRKPVAMTAREEQQEEEQIFMVVEVMPVFPGGDTALAGYLYKNIEYPVEAVENGIEGKVYVSFMVAKDGKIKNVKVLRGIGYGCDEEALRVIRDMPDWKPGKQRGRPVKVQMNLPIVFEME